MSRRASLKAVTTRPAAVQTTPSCTMVAPGSPTTAAPDALCRHATSWEVCVCEGVGGTETTEVMR
jgi:hypothetical protein